MLLRFVSLASPVAGVLVMALDLLIQWLAGAVLSVTSGYSIGSMAT